MSELSFATTQFLLVWMSIAGGILIKENRSDAAIGIAMFIVGLLIGLQWCFR